MECMNPEITPEILAALAQHPVGPIRLQGDADVGPVYLLRLDDIANLQELIDDRIREKLAEADADIAAGHVEEWDVESVKRRGRDRWEKNDAT